MLAAPAFSTNLSASQKSSTGDAVSYVPTTFLLSGSNLICFLRKDVLRASQFIRRTQAEKGNQAFEWPSLSMDDITLLESTGSEVLQLADGQLICSVCYKYLFFALSDL